MFVERGRRVQATCWFTVGWRTRCPIAPTGPAILTAGIDDRLRDLQGVDLLHGDVERGLGSVDEVGDYLLEIVGRAELDRAEIDVDLAVGEALH